MMKIILFMSLSSLVAISQCDRYNSKYRNPILGRYELTGRDNTGQPAFAGTISFVSIEQNHLKGPCKIITQQNAPEGLFEKDGNCEAIMDGNKISVDSAPSLDDAGLLLEGEFDGKAIKGIWKLDGFVTSNPLGTFAAEKKD
jgi:hypothetical protein